MKSEKILWQMLNIFRRHPHFTIYESTQVALQILAWAKLSVNERLPSDLQLTKESQLTTFPELFNSFKKLSEYPELGENKAAFEDIAYLLHRDVSWGVVVDAIDFALDSAKNNLLNYFDFPEDFYLSFLSHGSPMPIEVIKVMSALAGELKEKTLYCPYDSLCLIAREVGKQGGIPSIETPWVSPIPWLISILTDANIHTIVSSDPLQRPEFLKEGNVQKFDFTIAFPPFGQKIDIEVVERDFFNRFKERTSSGSVLTLRHIIAQTEGKAIVAIPGNILFSRGAEHSLREDLLNQGMIEAVISMPPALLPFTAIPFSILILNTRDKVSTVRFVDGAAEQFSTRDGRNRSKLVNWKLLIETFHKSNDEAIVANIPTIHILENDANLEVSHYLLPPAQKVVRHLLSRNETRKLSHLVEFLRPSKPLPKNETEGILALEVGLSDFPNYGYLTTPKRQVLLSPKVFNSQEKKSFLCPGDIIILVKGSAGKLAITPDNVPPVGPNAWVANQSSLIMRPQDSIIDPRFLFMYLCSDVGETLLKGIISGATVPLIQLQQLKDVEIIVLDRAKQESIISTFNEQVQIQDQINHLQEQLQHLSKVHWDIPSSTRG